MNAPKESLYDTKEAIALSLQLTGAANAASNEKSPYIRFSAGARPEPSMARRESQPAPVPQENTIALPEETFAGWEEMLKWVKDVSSAKSCFVVDSQGFVLLREGEDQPDDGFEGAGANLGIAVDQLNQMEIDSGEIQIADLTYQNRSLMVIRVKDKDGDYFTLGVLDADKLSGENKIQVYRQIRRSLAQNSL